MKTILILLIILAQVAFAEPEAGLFGSPDAAPSLSVSGMGGGFRYLLTAERQKDGIMEYRLGISKKDGSQTQLQLTKEDFTTCYILASKAIRQFHRSPPSKPRTGMDLRSMWVGGEGEQVMLSYEVDALSENPLLQELSTRVATLAKQP